MADAPAGAGSERTRSAAGGSPNPQIDWVAAERSPEFRELIAKRRRFVLPATVFFLVWYLGFILLAGADEEFMGREFITDGLTVGYAFAFSQFLMVWILAAMYLRRARETFDPLAEKAAEKARGVAAGNRTEGER